ncbi:hypothetical protein BN946_scf184592.g3 [Trametes cinnabarina]|uniref:50S ribosomal protein L36 n=1 Tax=Pycnoporus cinnabarinus TaxID=5643 RepID=A0A060SRC3_PYCCI|nr:hypothetical protein BN946_scf184592.g3 [Trametes cinnabarina]
MSLLAAFSCSSRTGASSSLISRNATGAAAVQTRSVSSSPYGRTHVWKRRQKKLPNPMVPVFPQRLVRVDGSTIIHYTTSPRSTIRLTRDTTNNPVWNAARFVGMDEEEDEVTGRMGRFSRKFGELGGQRSDMDWLNEATGDAVEVPVEDSTKPKSKK